MTDNTYLQFKEEAIQNEQTSINTAKKQHKELNKSK